MVNPSTPKPPWQPTVTKCSQPPLQPFVVSRAAVPGGPCRTTPPDAATTPVAIPILRTAAVYPRPPSGRAPHLFRRGGSVTHPSSGHPNFG